MKFFKNLSIYGLFPLILAVSLMSVPLISLKKEVKSLKFDKTELTVKLGKYEELRSCIPKTLERVSITLCSTENYDFYYTVLGSVSWRKGTPLFNLEHGTITFNFVHDDNWACVSETEFKTVRAFKDGEELNVSVQSNSQGGCNYVIQF